MEKAPFKSKRYLKYDALSFICTNSEPTPWPNPIKRQDIKQYLFSSKRLASISLLHSIWYREINGKYIKILPKNIEKLLTPLSLAHWIMGDGYFDQSVKICTDNFTKEEVGILIKIFSNKFGIKATLRKRTNPNSSIIWRISISKLSMEKLKIFMSPYVIPKMLYKLGIIR